MTFPFSLVSSTFAMAKRFNSSIFSYGFPDKVEGLYANLNGTDKKNIRWEAREVWKVDMPNYESLFTDKEVVKYFYQERPWTIDRIKSYVERWVELYNEGQPHGAFSIFNEQGGFIGYIEAGAEGKGVSEVTYALSHGYWGKGIGQSALSKIIEE